MITRYGLKRMVKGVVGVMCVTCTLLEILSYYKITTLLMI